MIKTIELYNILEFYDVPQIFLGRDIVGTKYLCMLYDDEDYYKYLSIKISQNKIFQLLSGGIDLRQLFMHPEIIGEYFIVSYLKNIYNIERYHFIGNISENMLPEEGYFIENINQNHDILSESIEYKHPVIHLGFIDSKNSPSIPVNLLSALTIQYQSLIANCYKKIDGKRKDKDFNLRVFAYSRASFNVHMYAESDLNLFGSSRLNNTLSIIDDLLSNPTDDLKNRLIPLKGHTVRSYKSFIKLLLENNISIKYKWVSSISESHVVGNRVSFENLNRIYKVLEESLELENEIKKFQGVIISSSVETSKWTLRTDTGTNISGSSNIKNILYGIVMGEKRYELTCQEIIEQNNISSKEKINYVLLDITEI